MNIAFGYLDRVIPYSHQFSFGLQGLLPGGLVAEATYSGNQTRRLPVSVDINAIPASEMGKPVSYYQERVTNPLAGLLPLSAARNGATILRQELLRPFPQYGSMTMTDIPLGRNNYHGLQMRLIKRYSSGLTVQAAYTVSKTLEEISFLNAQDFNLSNIDRSHLEKRLAQFDVPQKFSLVSTAELPFWTGTTLVEPRRCWQTVVGLASEWAVDPAIRVSRGLSKRSPVVGAKPQAARLAA